MVSLGRRGLLLSTVPSTSPMPQQSLLLPSPVQLLRSLTECLTVDPLSANVWRQLYPKHLSQSRQVGGRVSATSHSHGGALVQASQPLPVQDAEGKHLLLLLGLVSLKLSGNIAGWPLRSWSSASRGAVIQPEAARGLMEDGKGRVGPLIKRGCAFPTACCWSICSGPGSGFPRR